MLSVQGMDEQALRMRRTVARYMAAAFIMMFRSLSPPVKKRWPTLGSVTDSGESLCTDINSKQ